MITDLIFFKPSLKVVFEGQIVGGLSYFVRETIPVVGGSNREDCFTKHTTSEWYLTVPPVLYIFFIDLYRAVVLNLFRL